MTAVLIVFLMVGAWALVSASQQWAVRRDAQGAAAAAARAAAQGDQTALRSGGVLDADGATQRAQSIIGASGYTGSVSVDGSTVTVTINAGVDYSFPSPGFPATVDASAAAVAVGGVTGDEGG